MNNETNIGIKFTNKVTNEKKVEKYRQELSKIYALLQSMDKGKILAIDNATKTTTDALKQQNKLMENNGSESQKMARNFNLAFNYTTLRTFTRALKNVVGAMSSMTKQSASYLENMNLLDVAFNNNTREADKFVNKLSEMYGLDESWGYRTVGIFKQLANAMGISAEAGNKLATVLTQLSIDTASLYNIETSDAVSIFSSALAGQTKPARRLGADITQSTLQQTLDTAGIKEYVANLTYAEKRLVIVASLLQQLTEANNDWGRTIESVANQTRIMNEQWDRLTRAVGNVFLPIIKQLLPYLNAILMVFTEIISAIAILVGYNEEDFDYFGGTAESVIDLQEGLEGANASAKKLNSSLRSFDRLNNISTSKGASGGVGIGGSGISPDIMKLFNAEVDKYNDTLTNVQMKATKIRDSIMKWLGFQKKINPLTKDVSFEFDHITSGTVLGALVVGGSIYKGIKSIISILGKFNIGKTTKETSAAFTKLKSSISGLLIGAGSLLVLNAAVKDLSINGKNSANAIGTLAGSLGTIAGFTLAGAKLGGVWGAAAGAIGGLIAQFVLFSTEYSYAVQNIVDENKKMTQSLDELYEANKQAFITSSTEAGYYEKLAKELNNLVDANGEVKKGYEARVQFILDELNNAYGLELELIDGAVKGWGKEKEAIDKVIAAQKAQIALDYAKANYQTAMANIDTYNEQLKKTQDEYDRQVARFHDEQKKLKEYYAYMWEKESATTKAIYGSVENYMNANEKIHDSLKQTKEDLKGAEQALDTAKANVDKNTKAIVTYNNLLSASYDGTAEEIDKAVNEIYEANKTGGKNITDTLRNQIIDYESYMRVMGGNYEKLTEKQKQEADARLDIIKNTLSEEIDYTNGVSPTVAEAWYKLSQASETKFLDGFKGLNDDIRKQVIDKMYQQGYDISSELQRGINAINPKLKVKVGLEIDKAVNLFNSFNNSLAKSFGIKLPTLDAKAIKKIAGYAGGGLPKVGQLMYVNEKGPELVSQIGGQSFVANQNQVVDFMEREIGNAKSNTPQVMNFYLDPNNKLVTYTLDKLQNMAKSNGQPIEIGG